MDISVIIPVYNTESYLRRCVDSVIGQQSVELEIILVDDGSTDASPSICDDYANKYPNVRCKHTKNSGPATAKNIGYELATGNYVVFIDSDDKIKPDMLKKMLNMAYKHSADIVCCNYVQVDEQGNISHTDCTNQEYVLDKHGGLKHLLLKDKIYSQCWTKIYRKKMLDENHVVNVDGLKTDEDFLFNINAFVASDVVCIVDEPLYVYTHRENSLSHDYYRKNINQFINNMTLRLKTVDSIIKERYPELVEYSTFHCLMYYNELIGKVSLHPSYYNDKRIRQVFSYMKANYPILQKYYARCGFSKNGLLMFKILPRILYLVYRKSHLTH